MGYLINYSYPGNIRELQNAVLRGLTLGEGRLILPVDLPPEICEKGMPLLTEGVGEAFPDTLTLEQLEVRYIARVIERKGGNLTQAARSLGISRSTIWRKIRKHGIPTVSK